MEHNYTLGTLVRSVTAMLFFSLLTLTVQGQTIWSNTITGTNPNASNPFTAGQTTDPNVTVSGIGRGPGITGANANDRYNASNWSTTALDTNDYFTFTITPNSNIALNLASFTYTAQASGSGPGNFAFRSNLDGFTANIGTPTAGGTTIDLSAIQNQTSAVTFRMYAWGGSGGTFSVNDFSFTGTTALPVHLVSFLAARQQQAVLLQWHTAMEKNLSHFEIERSKDGLHFSVAGSINARNQAVGASYTYTDRPAADEAVYYKLRMVDVDGSYTYSPVVAVPGKGKTSRVVLGANLVKDRLPVAFPDQTVAELYIADLAGKVWQRQTVNNTTTFNWDISSLPAGMYLLQVKEAGAVTSFKFVKE